MKIIRIVDVRAACRSGDAQRVRMSADVSLYDIAPEVGVTVSTLSRWERGLSRPTGKHALVYGRVLARLANANAKNAPPEGSAA